MNCFIKFISPKHPIILNKSRIKVYNSTLFKNILPLVFQTNKTRPTKLF